MMKKLWKLLPRFMRPKRMLFCLYCGHVFLYRQGDDIAQAVEDMNKHDQRRSRT